MLRGYMVKRLVNQQMPYFMDTIDGLVALEPEYHSAISFFYFCWVLGRERIVPPLPAVLLAKEKSPKAPFKSTLVWVPGPDDLLLAALLVTLLPSWFACWLRSNSTFNEKELIFHDGIRGSLIGSRHGFVFLASWDIWNGPIQPAQ
jgi:hypothetical protein